MPLALACLAIVLAAGGCSAGDDVGGGELSFALPVHDGFMIHSDPNDPRWRPSPPEGVPNVVCRGPAALVSDCCQPPAPTAAIDCQQYPLTCDDNNLCALAFDYDDALLPIDLGQDVSALKDRRGWVLAHATVDVIDTSVNLDGLPIRAASLYVAPQGATSAQAAGARFLGDIQPDSQPLALTPDARVAFSSFLVDFNTPFTLILSAHVVQEATSSARQGVVATVQVSGWVNASF